MNSGEGFKKRQRGTAVLLMTAVFFLSVVFSPELESLASPVDEVNCSDIQFEEKTYDFGVAGQLEKISHTYTFRNAGKGTLVIKDVTASCGCIAAVVSPRGEVPPGGTGAIEAVFEIGRYLGKQLKSIHVYSNDPLKPDIELEMSGTIKTGIILEPGSFYFGVLEKGKAVKRTVTLTQIEGAELKIDKIEAPEDYFLIRASNFASRGHKGFSIEVTLKSDAPVGRFTDVITLHTNSDKQPRIDIPVMGEVTGRIRVKPQMISAGTLHKGSALRNKIYVESADRKGFHILKVISELPFLSTEVRCLKKNNRFEIALSVNDKAPAGALHAEVQIYTDVPEQPVITVPVYGVIMK